MHLILPLKLGKDQANNYLGRTSSLKIYLVLPIVPYLQVSQSRLRSQRLQNLNGETSIFNMIGEVKKSD